MHTKKFVRGSQVYYSPETVKKALNYLFENDELSSKEITKNLVIDFMRLSEERKAELMNDKLMSVQSDSHISCKLTTAADIVIRTTRLGYTRADAAYMFLMYVDPSLRLLELYDLVSDTPKEDRIKVYKEKAFNIFGEKIYPQKLLTLERAYEISLRNKKEVTRK